jgi:AcrR family transcriptional regulator
MAYPEKAGYDVYLRAAGEILEQKGDLTLHALAKRLGVRPQSLYRHAKSLAELKDRLATHGFLRLGLELQRAAGVEKTWLSLATAYRGFVKKHPQLYRLMAGPHGRSRNGTDALMSALTPLADLLGCSTNSRRFLVQHRLAWAFIHGFVSLEQEDQFLVTEGVEEAFRKGVAMVEMALPRLRKTSRGRES